MSTPELDPHFARAVRDELSALGTSRSRLQRHQRHTRAVAIGVGVVVAATATTGAAILVNTYPGETTVASLGNTVTITHTGTGQIDLGPAPENADVVSVKLSCTSDAGGRVSFLTRPQADTPGDQWVETPCPNTLRVPDALLPPDGSTSITITADSDTTWTASAQYATSATTEWGVNANGQTYGVTNHNGSPDLVAARATNGRYGYMLDSDWMVLDVDHPINIYKSDGTTVIGQWTVEPAPGDVPSPTPTK